MLRDFANLKRRMGDPESADKLLARAASAPSFSAIPYPRFGMQDLPTGISGYNPAVKTWVEEVARLVREGQYELAGVAADQAFLAIEVLPRKERYFEDEHFESIASSYIASGHKTDAAAVFEREIATSKQFWGSEHPGFARTLETVAWRYFIDLRMLGRAHELIDQAAQIISASDGDTSDAMSSIEDSRLRFAEFERNWQAVIALKDKIRGIWVAVHGANTKAIVIH